MRVCCYLEADSLSEIKIAGKDDIPNDIGNILELETSDTALKKYITKDNFRLRVNTVTKKMIGSGHHVDIYSMFFVDAKILGL